MSLQEEYTLTQEEEPAEADLDIFDALREYNETQAGPSGRRDLTIFLRNAEGVVVGGVKGATSRGWLHVGLLVVREEARRHGWGRRLLAAAEDEAWLRGCRNVYLDTFSYQARPFYEKQGYVVFGTLDDYDGGHQLYFLRKRLAEPEANILLWPNPQSGI